MSASDARSAANGSEPPWVDAVLRFWFEELGEDEWFASDHHLDERIRARFLPLHEQLMEHGVRAAATPRELLAAIVVLDQFSRNLFRDSPRAYAADPTARELARTIVERGWDRAMTHNERMFAYLPFEHSEDRDDQTLSVRLFAALGNESWTRYAQAHQQLIDRFGRFPHRNAILGRESTPEELARMAQPMGKF